MIKIGLITTLWRRHALERAVLSHYGTLAPSGVAIVGIAAGSEGAASRSVAESSGWQYVETPNQPLGAKHNAALRAFRDHEDVVGVVVVGSDDLLNARYFEGVAAAHGRGSELHKLRGAYVYDLATGRLAHTPRFATGAGRFWSRALLDRIGWAAWPDDRRRRLDGAADAHDHAADCRSWDHVIDGGGPVLVDIKSEENMWSFDQTIEMVGGELVADSGAWMEREFPGVIGRILTKSTA